MKNFINFISKQITEKQYEIKKMYPEKWLTRLYKSKYNDLTRESYTNSLSSKILKCRYSNFYLEGKNEENFIYNYL